jgi:hypothetical protein
MKISLSSLNETWVHVDTDAGILQELYDKLSFDVPGAKFMPAFRRRAWDGKIRLLDKKKCIIQKGLAHYIESYAKENNYGFLKNFSNVAYDSEVAREFIENTKWYSGGAEITPRDYQLDAIEKGITNKRYIALSPTGCLHPDTIIDIKIDNTTTVTFGELYNLVKAGVKPKVFTKTGWETVTDVYKKNTPGIQLEFTDGSVITGSIKHLILDDSDEWRTLDSLTIGEAISSKIVSRINSVLPTDWIDFTVDAEHQSYILSGLTHHNSGKSLIIASLIKFYHENVDGKILLVCPTTSLVEQMFSDIEDYFPYWNPKDKITKIYSGTERTDRKIIISTWQSIYDNPPSWFEGIEVVIGDETHLYSAKEVSKLFEKCVNAGHRYGFTGTLSGEKLHQLQLEGIFGKVHQITTTSELISKSQLSQFKINALVLGYSDQERKSAKEFSWEEEVSFLVGNERRNKYIAKLAASLKGNTLVLFSRVDTHGKPLFEMIQKITDKPVFFIYGGTQTDIREDVRKKIDSMTNGIIVASSQIFSTGVNIPSLQNIIFTHPSKSKIRTLQSIGRVMRLSKSKIGKSVLFDIVDDLRWKNKTNFAYKHFSERVKIYNSEDFEYKIIEIDFKG